MKKIIPFIAILTTALFISSCGSNNEKTIESEGTPIIENNQPQLQLISTQEDENALKTTKISLDNFTDIPEEIDGCSCYFSETAQQFKNDEYLFAANFDSIAFVSVNKKLVKLTLISTTREPDTFGDEDHIDIYKSDIYTVIVAIKYRESSEDEIWWNDGTIRLESRDGQKVVKEFVGECGC